MSSPQPGFGAGALATLIAPCDLSKFVNEYLGKQFLAIPGHAEKVRDLFSWPALNEILGYQAVAPHLRLAKDGAQLPLSSFLKTRYKVSGASTQSPLAVEVTAHLRDGATLILNEIEGLHPPIRSLAEELEAATRSVIQVNLYASWRSSRGFHLHYDDHDVFVIQIAGPKLWKVYRPTEKYPLTSATEPNPERLALETVWDAPLQPGDVLFIPRGWWHVVTPVDEPTMHLTAGLHPPNGLKMIEWALRDLSANELLRMDLPRFEDAPSQQRYLAGAQKIVADTLADPALMTRFLDHLNATAETRPVFSLPWSATEKILPDSPKSLIRLLSQTGLHPKPDGSGDVKLAFAGKELTFSDATAPLFEFLSVAAPISVADFCSRFENQFSTVDLRDFLADLARHGIIAVAEPE